MKKDSLQSHAFQLLLAASMGLLMTACAGDEPSDIQALPAGKFPIALTGTVDGRTSSRATVDGTWQGGEAIAGMLFYDGSAQAFYSTASSDGTIRVVDKDGISFYWQSTRAKYFIIANYPANFLGVKTDQSTLAAHLESDYLSGSDSISFNSHSLVFYHIMAKVTVALIPGEGITDVAGATVTFLNQKGTVGGHSEVTPYQNATALLSPQQMMGKPFIRVSLGGFNYIYTPIVFNEANLQGRNSYLYTVTVNKTGLSVVVSNSPTWTSGATEGVSSKPLLPGFVIADLKIGDYYYSDGTTSDGGYRKYANGTSERLPVSTLPGKTCIGIVFQAAPSRMSPSDRNKGWTHGYVMALSDAAVDSEWGEIINESNDGMLHLDDVFNTNVTTMSLLNKDLEGYRRNRFIIDKYGSGDGAVLKDTKYEAYYYAWQYGKTDNTRAFAAPTASSGWFLPSGGQWWDLLENLGKWDLSGYTDSPLINIGSPADKGATMNNMNRWLAELPGAGQIAIGDYWTSSEYSNQTVRTVHFGNESLVLSFGNKLNEKYRIRCILAF